MKIKLHVERVYYIDVLPRYFEVLLFRWLPIKIDGIAQPPQENPYHCLWVYTV